MPKEKSALLSIREAAEILQVSLMTLRRWDKKNILKAIRPSNTQPRRYFKSDIEKLLTTKD